MKSDSAHLTPCLRLGGGWLFLGLLLVALLPGSLLAQLPPRDVRSAQSRSGQFLITSLSSGPSLKLGTNPAFVRLEPSVLAISAERLRQQVWRQLDSTDRWRGKIFITIYQALSPQEPATITIERNKDGWQYGVLLPDVIERVRYVRAMTQVVLLELANRNAPHRSAEIPAWLIEGLTRQLLAANEVDVILPPPTTDMDGFQLTRTIISARRENPLAWAHTELLASTPPTFQELSWPAEGELAGATGERYGAAAQLFVSGLFELPDGRACARGMLAALPDHLNWQFAFLKAFQAHFQRPLEVEKWWALLVTRFTGRDLAQTWPAEDSRRKLDQALLSPVQVRTGTNDLPLSTELDLQSVVRDWRGEAQTQVLEAKLRELDLLRPNVATNVTPVVDGYRQTIATYLHQRDKAGLFRFLHRDGIRRQAAGRALKQLSVLDAQRAANNPPASGTPAEPASALDSSGQNHRTAGR